MNEAIRTRLLTASGSLLVATGLAATMVVGPAAFADTAGVTANAEVTNVLELTADAAEFTLTEAPGGTATATTGLTAKSNNEAGYNVTVQALVTELAGTGDNAEKIAIGDLKVNNELGTATAMSNTTPVTVHDTSARSAEAGDPITANYELTMPFVNADTYSGGLTFTAAAK